MNDFQNILYNDLMNLCDEPDSAFFYKDLTLTTKGIEYFYRVFNYRIASYTDFCKPSALECRGIMFEMECETIPSEGLIPIRIASMPMKKFFNFRENPFTLDIEFTKHNIANITHKKDGSLISTFIHNGELRLKSKGSLDSTQCVDAMKWLNERPRLRFAIKRVTKDFDCTIDMEWCSPKNRIVVGYDTSHLTILNIRDNKTGVYLNGWLLKKNTEMGKFWVQYEEPENIEKFIESISSTKDNIEGFVIELMNGQKIKIKTDKYIKLHHVKDSVNHPRQLFEAVLHEATDDIYSLFHDDQETIGTINTMEKIVKSTYNHIVSTVEDFYMDNKRLSRKEYAIKGQSIKDGLFSLKMYLYIGREPDYKAFSMKNPELFGLDFKKEE